MENDGRINKMMIILSKATLENVYACFVLANGARMEGIEAEIFFTFFGLEAMMKKEMEKIDMPDVREFLEILNASGVKLWACKLAMDMFHYKEEDMFADLDGVLTVGDFYKQGSGVGTHMLFI